jgi:hypothetical protein
MSILNSTDIINFLEYFLIDQIGIDMHKHNKIYPNMSIDKLRRSNYKLVMNDDVQ